MRQFGLLLIALLCALLAIPPAFAQIEVSDVRQLLGNWAVKIEDGKDRVRLLQIMALDPVGENRWRAEMNLSFLESTPKPIDPGLLEKTSRGYRLSYGTRTGSEVVAEYNPSGYFSGTLVSGRKSSRLDISPLTDDEFAELKSAETAKHRQAKFKRTIRPDTQLELIYLESTNYSCPYCRKWEKEYIGGKKLVDSDEGRSITITRVGTGRYISDNFLPESLRPYRAELEGKSKNLFRATPSFILMADNKPLSWGVGQLGWDTRVYPTLKWAVAEKLQKNK